MTLKDKQERIILFLVMCILLLCFGCSPTHKAQKLTRQALAKIEEARRLNPSVVDSIFGKQKVAMDLPAVSGTEEPKPEIDTTGFNFWMAKNDSLVTLGILLGDSLLNGIPDSLLGGIRYTSEAITSSPQHGDVWVQDDHLFARINGISYEIDKAEKQKIIDAIALNNKTLQATRNRLMRGFTKDSTYHYEDSTLVVDVEIKGGVIHSVFHKVKERHIETEVPKTEILLNTHKDPPYREPWFWGLGGLSAILIMALILVILVRRKT